MAKTSIVSHPVRAYYIALREDFLLLCQDAPDMHVAAFILDRFEHWTNSKLDTYRDDYDKAWVYKSIDEMQTDLYHQCGRNKVMDCLHWLIEMDYLEKRTNPNNNWDKTLQYRLVYKCLNFDLAIVWNENLDSLELNYQQFETKLAIPEKQVEKQKEIITGAIAETISSDHETVINYHAIIEQVLLDDWLSLTALAESIGVSPEDLSQIAASNAAQIALDSLVKEGHIEYSFLGNLNGEKHYRRKQETVHNITPRKSYRQNLIDSLGEAMGTLASKADESNYFRVSKLLTESGITVEEFPAYITFVRDESKSQNNWSVTVNSLVSNGRVSRYVTERDTKTNNNGYQVIGEGW